MILFSYACYTMVITLVRYFPLIGLLMIPKTIAYVVICVLAYRRFFRFVPVTTAM